MPLTLGGLCFSVIACEARNGFVHAVVTQAGVMAAGPALCAAQQHMFRKDRWRRDGPGGAAPPAWAC